MSEKSSNVEMVRATYHIDRNDCTTHHLQKYNIEHLAEELAMEEGLIERKQLFKIFPL